VQSQAVRTAAVWQVARLDRPLARFARDDRYPAAVRVEAARAFVARRPALDAEVLALLLSQLDRAGEPLARLRAAEVLGQAKLTDETRRKLIDAVRGDALVSPELVLPSFAASTSDETAKLLVDYLAEALRGGWRPRDEYLQQIISNLPASPKVQADELLQFERDQSKQLRELIAEFEPLLAGGDAERGRAVFTGRATGCAACHRVGGDGGRVGPDLTRIGAIRAPRDLLESIALPSATFAQGFNSYTVVTSEGKVAGGVIARQDDRVVVLRDASGAEVRLPRESIESITSQEKSLMPEGLPRAMTREEFRDLLAYLKSLR
jgi:putative heme-binding domain-containing protein